MFSVPLDIANMALQHMGQPRIATLGDMSPSAVEINFCYDKLRQGLLRTHVWRYATRATALRPITSTTQLITFPAYAAATTYQQGDIVNDTTINAGNSGTALYFSLVASNTGNTPSSSPAQWTPYIGPVTADTYSASATYSVGEMAVSSSHIFLSVANGNINNTPPGGGFWTAAKLTGTDSNFSTVFIPYPLGQFSNGTTRPIYRMPFGYLRVAPQDPKNPTGGVFQTTGAGMQYSDFQITGNHMLTSFSPSVVATGGPLIFRFVADISNVADMEPLFCHLLALDIANLLCERFTKNPNLAERLFIQRENYFNAAVAANMLEQGSTEPPEKTYPVSRLPPSQEMLMQVNQRQQ